MRRRRLVHAVMLAGIVGGATPWSTADAQGNAGRRGGRPPQPPRPSVQEKAFEWSGELASGQRVVVRSVFGHIRVEPATGRSLEIVARKVWRRGDPAVAKIDVARINDGRDVLVCARWPGTTTCTESEYVHSSSGDHTGNDVYVEFTILLPAGTNASLNTTMGEIRVTGATGDIQAFTTNGDIRVETTGAVLRAETTNGEVRARMTKLPAREGRYSTVNGTVVVTLPDGINANIDAGTQLGSFSTDFPIAVQGAFSSKHVRGAIGKGGPMLVLESITRDVRVLKQ